MSSMWSGKRPKVFSCGTCGHSFKPDSERKRPKYVSQGLKRGQKKCPVCSLANAARTKKCVCGHEFIKTKGEES
jgi:rubredoxin